MKQERKAKWYTNLLPRLFRHPATSDSASVVPDPAAKPLEWEQKSVIKEKYTSGSEYFLFAGDIDPRRHQLLTMLKAFSQFKKWQGSEMKLVIAGNTTRRTKELKKKLATFKYKEDVIILEELVPSSALLNIIAASYLFIYFDNKDFFSANILNALQSQVPVITGNTPLITKIIGERGILISPDNHEELAANMLRFYKDEDFRSAQVEKGLTF